MFFLLKLPIKKQTGYYYIIIYHYIYVIVFAPKILKIYKNTKCNFNNLNKISSNYLNL
jgi:hypothetical protein